MSLGMFMPMSVGGGSGFPTVVNTAADNVQLSTSATYNAPLPASLVSGDLLLLIVGIGSGNLRSFSTPSGWSELINTPGGGNVRRFVVIYKIADGTEGVSLGLTTGGSGANTNWSSIAYRISGASHAEVSPTTTGTSSFPNPASLSPLAGLGKYLWLPSGAKLDGSAPATSAPTDYSDLLTAGINNCGIYTARRSLQTATEDPGPFTIPSGTNDWIVATIAVSPL